MNYKKLFNFYIFSIIFTLILGTILHFTYVWSNNNIIVASFSAVNESTWEHLKLIFFPMLITIVISYFYLGSDFEKYLCSKTIGIIIGMLFITVFFYTYTGIIGTNYAIINIGSFILAVILSEYITYLIIKSNYTCNKKLTIIILLLLLLFFVFFTYFTPKINYFKDPVSNTYGIQKASRKLEAFKY